MDPNMFCNGFGDGIAPIKFYGKLKTVAKKVTLKDAQAAISALADSDVDDIVYDDDEKDGTDQEVEVERNNEQENEETVDEQKDEETEDEENIPLAILAERLRRPNTKKKSDPKSMIWKDCQFSPPNIVFTPSDPNGDKFHESKTPLEYFSKYFPNEIFSELAKTEGVSTQILRMYWIPATRIHFLEDLRLPRNRFESLRNNLHIVDVNQEHNDDDKLWKIRPIIESFEKRCEELVVEENLCIDESIIPFKGPLVVKQYTKGKPNPWGVKVFMLCGASGIIYRSIVYQGSTTLPVDVQNDYSATNGLVIYLSNRIPEHRGHKLFCDNYFTSLVLLQELLNKGIFMAGTIHANRLQKCPLKSENQLKKIDRGTCDSHVTDDKKIVAVRWYDNKAVNIASNFVGIEPEDEVRRWDKKERAYIMVERPAIVRLYNFSMGGVDKSDFLIALYRTFIRSKKLTLRVIFHYFNLAICNAWLEYQSNMERMGTIKTARMDLLQFTMSVANGLAFSGCPTITPKRGRPSSVSPRNSPILVKRQRPQTVPVDDVRYDNLAHWPIKMATSSAVSLMLVGDVLEFTVKNVRYSTIYHSDNHTNSIVAAMNQMRKDIFLCDVTLVTNDTEMPSHKMVLAAASPFLYTIFANSEENRVNLNTINSDTLSSIFDFIYTSKVEITDGNVQDILLAADLLQLDDLRDFCLKFLKDRLNFANCLGIWRNTDLNDFQDLLKNVEDFILANFSDVAKSQDFLGLSHDEICDIIAKDELKVATEKEVFEAVLTWTKQDVELRQRHFVSLMKNVRICFLPKKYITESFLEEPLLKDDPQCQGFVIEGLKCCLPNTNANPRIRRRQYTKLSKILLVAGGDSSSKSVEYYCFKKKVWSKLADMPINHDGAGATVLNGKVNIVGGDGENSVDIYNVDTDRWIPSIGMQFKRQYLGVATLKNCIYAVGGYANGGSLNTVEQFDPETEQWSSVAPMLTKRIHHGVGVIDGILYAVGGRDNGNGNRLSSVESYNPTTNTWTYVKNMHLKRNSVGVGVLNGMLYAVGGYDGSSDLKSAEVFDPKTGNWAMIKDMHNRRRNVAVVATNDLLYVVGGYGDLNSSTSAEVYDPKTMTWSVLPDSMSIPRQLHCAAIIDKFS